MVCHEDLSISAAEQGTIIIEQYEVHISEKFSSFVIKVSVILLPDAEQGYRRNSSQLVGLLADSSSEKNIYKRYIKSPVNYSDITTRNMMKLMEDDGCCSPGERQRCRKGGLRHIIREGCD